MTHQTDVLVVGAGIFGVTAALELQMRGHAVTLIDPGPIPHPLASSTDITKMIRMDYGSDDFYFDLMERAFAGWDDWNAMWGEELYHEDGFLLATRELMANGSFEMESFKRLTERGYQPQRLSSLILAEDHPHWNADAYTDGYINQRGGWAESGAVVARLTEDAQLNGVQVIEGVRFTSLLHGDGGRVTGIRAEDGTTYAAETVVLATGAWTPAYLPELADRMWVTGQPVLHLLPEELNSFHPPEFLPWSADISNTGWYGFPVDRTGVVKVANHGEGIRIDPINDPRNLPPDAVPKFRKFAAQTFPTLAGAPVVGSRLCLYCDTFDGDLWIGEHPEYAGLVVAAGGSGHGFKFAPVLGEIIADAVEGIPNPAHDRFGWRERGGASVRTEQARYSGNRAIAYRLSLL